MMYVSVKKKGWILALFIIGQFFYANVNAGEHIDLGDLLDGNQSSYAFGISDDGNVVVGAAQYSDTWHETIAYRWTLDGGMVSLGGSDPETFYGSSVAQDVSADGSAIVGYSYNSDWGENEAFLWTAEGGLRYLGDLPGDFSFSEALAVSADGQVVVGESVSAFGYEAFRWESATSEAGLVGLGALDGGFYSRATGVSSDGSVVVGVSGSTLGQQAFRWTESGDMVGLGDLSGGSFNSSAYDVSADGSVVVGGSSSGLGYEAFRWTLADNVMAPLGALPRETPYSLAYAVSSDGNTVVGESRNSDGDYVAVLWTEGAGIQSIKDVLIADGIDMSTWELYVANDVSADGTVIVGDGNSIPFDGENHAWLVRLGSGLVTPDAIAGSVETVLPTTESAHGLSREALLTHLRAARHYRGRPESSFNLYASGFGGEWNSYTAGGTIGLTWDVSDAIRLGTGVFSSKYMEDDLPYSGEYELDSLGGTLWAGYEAVGGGLQLHVVGMLADLDNEIERGYLNGSGTDKSKGDTDGDMVGIMVRCGWEIPITENSSLTPFASYSWTEVEFDAYSESGGGFPVQFDARKDTSETVKVGLEGESGLSETVSLWGQAAYAKKLDDESDGISGEVIGLMDFSLPGYELDDDWFDADLGFKWKALSNLSFMLTVGSAFGNDQNPEWRTSLGASWSIN